ncbi:MAG: isopenicillin N synthase family oxygenase [Cyanobacteria bacterium]|nr:isopenicillin N synthase family oxygenase [Cyanobacteriota bacterium]MDA0865227.1 isopenicillin N synthase family oxygenase [Cyanobacteriota bacterium]
MNQTIPVLDLQVFQHGDPIQQADFVQTLKTALESLGFFALINHGVDSALIQAAYGVTTTVFELPAATKAHYEDLSLHGQRGFTHFGREHAKDHPHPDLKEFWHIGRASALPANLWPGEVPAFQPVLTELFQQLEHCSLQLLQACALALDLPRHYFRERVFDSPTLLRVIHYPPIPPEAHPASLRAAPHQDINLITLLCEATAPGLELLQRDGQWRAIAPLPGQIIVDSGDMLQNLTNGLFPSTTHRVVNPDQDRERRFSLPFFVHPRPEVDLTPLPQCVAQTGGALRYPSLTAGAYLAQRLQEIGLSQA